MQDSELSFNPPRYQSVPTLVLLLFCGYVIIWYLQIGYRRPELGAMRFEFFYAAILSLFALNYTSAANYQCPLTKHLILYFIVVIIQIPFSYNADYSWQVFVDRIVKFAFMAWFIIAFVKSPKGLIFFLCAFMLACMKMGEEGFLGQLTGSLVWQNQGIMRLHGTTPLYEHPNSFSGMALGTLPFVITFFPIVNKYLKALLALQTAFAMNIIIFSGSRTAYVGTLVLVLVTIIKSKNNKVKLGFILGVAALCSIQIIPAEYMGRFASIYDPNKQVEGTSSQGRILILKDAWAIFIEHPFGIGVAAFPFIREDIYGRSQDTHNLYLEIATNLGIQGLIVFGLFINSLLKTLNRIRILSEEKANKLVQAVLTGEDKNNEKRKYILNLRLLEASARAVYLFIIVRLTLGLFGMDLYEIYWWFASGLTIALYNIQKIALGKV